MPISEESDSPTAVNGAIGGLSPLSSISSMPSSAATAVASALDDVAEEAQLLAEAEAADSTPASLPPFAEGSRFKVLNRMGINVRPTNDMVVSSISLFFCFFLFFLVWFGVG